MMTSRASPGDASSPSHGRATEFISKQVTEWGGYVYAVSGVLQLRAGEGTVTDRVIWVEHRPLRHHKVQPDSGIIDSQTFAAHVRTLCRFIRMR